MDILKLRTQLKMTQAQLAERLGTTVVTISRWENGHVKPSKMALKAVEAMVKRKD